MESIKETHQQALAAQLRAAVQDELAQRIPLLPGNPDDNTVEELIRRVVNDFSGMGDFRAIHRETVGQLTQGIVDDFLHYGPITHLLNDDSISEIMVNGAGFDEDGNMLPHVTWIERRGKLELADVRWENDDHVIQIMNRICGESGRHIDAANPIEDASLRDGSRFNGTAYPLAPDGSTFNIRKFQQNRLGYRELVAGQTLTPKELSFLATAVAARCSILISGGTGSGKTTFLNMLSGFIPHSERILTIEDTCELLVHKEHPHVVRFEARKANSEGMGEITLNDHLVAALRKRPDRIIVGECRGPEAYTMLEAMNTGHDGSMTTIHANDAQSALTRLTTLVMQGDDSLSEGTVKAKIADALDLIVQVQRKSDGRRVVTEIMAVGSFQEGVIQHEMLYRFDQEGTDPNGKVIGHHTALGAQPAEIRKKIEEAGYEYDLEWMQSEAS